MKPKSLKQGDTIGIVAPSRPILLIKKEIDKGIMNLRKLGYKIKLGKNLEKRLYYSAGTPKEKADDINAMFKDKEVKAIICATGGSSSNQTIQYLDFDMLQLQQLGLPSGFRSDVYWLYNLLRNLYADKKKRNSLP